MLFHIVNTWTESIDFCLLITSVNNAMNQWQCGTLKNAQLAPKAGKVVTGAKRGKTWAACQAREIMFCKPSVRPYEALCATLAPGDK